MKKTKKQGDQTEPAFKEWIAPEFKNIAVIGVGGTGSYLVNGLCKLIAGYNLPIQLTFVDPDTVEERNIHRQNFAAWEVGESKAEALSYRMSQLFGLAINAHVGKGEDYLAKNPQIYFDYNRERNKTLVVCCVDNFASRLKMQEFTPMLDAGNSLEHGQVIFGTCNDPKEIKKEIRQWGKTPNVQHLPCPVIKAGMGQLAEDQPEEIGCADHPFTEQSAFINELAAQACLVILQQILIAGRVTVPAIYFDSGRGRMNPAKLTKNYLRF